MAARPTLCSCIKLGPERRSSHRVSSRHLSALTRKSSSRWRPPAHGSRHGQRRGRRHVVRTFRRKLGENSAYLLLQLVQLRHQRGEAEHFYAQRLLRGALPWPRAWRHRSAGGEPHPPAPPSCARRALGLQVVREGSSHRARSSRVRRVDERSLVAGSSGDRCLDADPKHSYQRAPNRKADWKFS